MFRKVIELIKFYKNVIKLFLSPIGHRTFKKIIDNPVLTSVAEIGLGGRLIAA